jgi:HEAT repeat protein
MRTRLQGRVHGRVHGSRIDQHLGCEQRQLGPLASRHALSLARVKEISSGAQVNDRRVAVLLAGVNGDAATARSGLGDEAASVRSAALSALLRLDALTTNDVEVALADPSPVVRRRVCELSTTSPAGHFERLLEDEVPEVVEAAAFACGEQEIAAAVGALARVATTHTDALCRESAVAALGVLGSNDGLAAVLQAITDVAAVRRRAVIALSNYEGDEVSQALEVALTDRDWQVRQAAEDVIGINRTSTQ